MTAYYNEIDPYAAQWIRNLIAAGHIAAGDVDERSIEDVRPDELMGYTQCHFFAGVGVWSYALRNAGWPDDRQVWTGSCPCQPFSTAGKGAGFDDERHLWPHFQWLIQQCQPAVVFGEQVASKTTEPWLDLVHADMEALGYAFGCVPFPSAGVGAPHIRDRAYWVAHASMRGRQQQQDARPAKVFRGEAATKEQVQQLSADRASLVGVGDADHIDRRIELRQPQREGTRPREQSSRNCRNDLDEHPSSTNGFWADVDWLLCRDGKWRCAEPGTFPLAHGAPARVGRLRAYGNAINAYQAQIFIESAMEAQHDA